MTAKYTSHSKDLRAGDAVPPISIRIGTHSDARAAVRGTKWAISPGKDKNRKARLVKLLSNGLGVRSCALTDMARARRDLEKNVMTVLNVTSCRVGPKSGVQDLCRTEPPRLSHARLSTLSMDELVDLIFDQASSDEVAERCESLRRCVATPESDEGA